MSGKKENGQVEIVPPDPTENADLRELMPQMNIVVPANRQSGDISTLVSDETLLGVYNDVVDGLKEDRTQIDDLLSNFADMVFNGGDASTASKDAVVGLMKLKQDTADKMTKIADLMTRLKMKERDTMAGWQKANYNQTNNVTISGGGGSKRDLIQRLEKEVKKEKK